MMHRRSWGRSGLPAIVAAGTWLAAAAGSVVPPPVAPDIAGAPLPPPAADEADTHTLGEPPQVHPDELGRTSMIEGRVEHRAGNELVVRDSGGDQRRLVVPREAWAPGVEASDLTEGSIVRAAYEERGAENVVVRIEAAH